jgi:hypothetical protein
MTNWLPLLKKQHYLNTYMKFIKLDLLTLLIGLFLFASCENTATIGLEVDPDGAIKGDLLQNVAVSSRTVLDEPAPTYIIAKHPLGYLVDPVLGTTESALAMSVNLPSDGYDFGTSPVLDSAVLVLNYSTDFYGDSTSNYSIDVNQLTNNLVKETSFLSDRTYSYNSVVIGNKTGKVYPNTKFKISDMVAGKPDTLRTVTPQLRIKLDPNLVRDRIINIDPNERKFNSYFQEAFKGLYVKVNNASGTGGIMFFDFAGTSSNLALYYKKQNATNSNLTDTVAVNFPIATVQGSGPVAAAVKHSYSTAVQTQLDNPTTAYPITYVQGLGGLRNKIAFDNLNTVVNAIGKVVVNRAELVIDLSTGTDNAPFSAAPRLSLYRNDIAAQRKNLPDNDAGIPNVAAADPRVLPSTVFGGYFNPTTKQYIFVLTSYVQDLVNNKTTDYGTYLATTPATTFTSLPYYSSGNSFATAGRAVLGSFGAPTNKMKLNIYYTKIQ